MEITLHYWLNFIGNSYNYYYYCCCLFTFFLECDVAVMIVKRRAIYEFKFLLKKIPKFVIKGLIKYYYFYILPFLK